MGLELVKRFENEFLGVERGKLRFFMWKGGKMDEIVLLVEMCCNFTFIVNYAFARRFQNVHLLIEGFVSENVKIQSIYKKSTYYLKIITYNKNNKFIYHNPKRRFTNQFSVLNRFRFHNNYLRHYLPLHYPHH